MKVLRRFWRAGLAFVLILCMSFMCFSCVGRRDVSIRVSDNYGNQWFFPPDVDELSFEMEYTGEKRTFGVSGWKIERHHKYGRYWFAPSGSREYAFNGSSFYINEDGEYIAIRYVKDRGTYNFGWSIGKTDLWNYRSIRLKIKVI